MLLSLIIPVFNRKRHLPRVIQSVFAQTCQNFQLILADNESSDGSYEYIQQLLHEEQKKGLHPHIKKDLIRVSKRGACACRNEALKIAEGEYVYFFDSDDELSRTYIEDITQSIKASTFRPDLILTAFNKERNGRKKKHIFFSHITLRKQIITGAIATQSFVARREFLSLCGGWNVNVHRWNDWELGIRLLVCNPLILTIKGRYYHRVFEHDDSITGQDYGHSAKDLWCSCRAAEDTLIRNNADIKNIRALGLREILLASWLRNEGSYEEAESFRIDAFRLVGGNVFLRIMAKLLFHYTAWGGRGGWRLALLCLGPK